MRKESLFAYAALCLALVVALGAIGAHALETRISPRYLGVWQTACTYFAYQSLALMALAAMNKNLRGLWISILGSWIFSGSLWVLALNELLNPGLKILGAITPIGGVLLIAGWIFTAYQLYRLRA
ncbi:MAG: DUF423 domain-containing protein [Bacteroidia bacterium]